MRAALIIVFVLQCASFAKGDSVAWPPSPRACNDSSRSFLFVFDPVVEKNEFQSTTIYYFECDPSFSRYLCSLRRSVKAGLRPRYAFMTKKHGQILLLNESRFEDESQAAIVVFDADSGTIVKRKSREDLFPGIEWPGSTSQTPWIASAELSSDGNSVRIVTVKPEPDDDGKQLIAKVVRFDLTTLEARVTKNEEEANHTGEPVSPSRAGSP